MCFLDGKNSSPELPSNPPLPVDTEPHSPLECVARLYPALTDKRIADPLEDHPMALVIRMDAIF